MNVLIVHNAYREPGGEDTAVRTDAAMLREAGHSVDEWIVHNRDVDTSQPIHLARNTVWNTDTEREARARVSAGTFDVVHVHNTLPILSPSVFGAFRSGGAAVVHSLHNYRMVCPAGTLFRDGKVCTDCTGTLFRTPSVRHACYRESRSASAVTSAMLAFHDLRRTWSRDVDAFIAVSPFVRTTLASSAIPLDRIHVRPNSLADMPPAGDGSGGHVLYAGRLVAEKGLLDILEAWKHMPANVRLMVAGDGPLRLQVEQAASTQPNIVFRGQLSRADLLQAMGSALLTVVPSRWHEPFGLVAIESLATGTPVMVRNVGGLGDLVDGTPGVTPLPDPESDPMAFADSIRQAAKQPASRDAIRNHALSTWSAEDSLDRLLEIYALATTHRNAA